MNSFYQAGEVVAERFEVLCLVGEGASGAVYRARDLYVDAAQEIVALKVIDPELVGDRQVSGRFRREARILQCLEGENLCKLLDFVEHEGLVMLSIEYVNGPSLDAYLVSPSLLPLAEVVSIVTQVCAGLQAAHDAGVIHRDLKPANVLVDGCGPEAVYGDNGPDAPPSFRAGLRARVVDFGLAKFVQGEPGGVALTEHDMIFGTPDYMSPEQVAGEELDGRCDVYACGVMLFELLVGAAPFETESPLATMTAHLSQAPPSARELMPGRVGPMLDAVIRKALAKEREERFSTPRALSDALLRAVEVDPLPDARGTTAPELGTTEPGLGTTEPGLGTTEPGLGTTEPGLGTTAPGLATGDTALDSRPQATPTPGIAGGASTTLASESPAQVMAMSPVKAVEIRVEDARVVEDKVVEAKPSRIDFGWWLAGAAMVLLAVAAGVWFGLR